MENYIALASLSVAILIAIVGDSGLIAILNRANVRYIRTYTLKKGAEFVQGIILINIGRKIAKNIKLKVIYKNSVISDIHIEDDMLEKKGVIDEGGIGEKYAVLNLSGLYSKAQATIHITLNNQEDNPSIKGTFDDAEIVEEDYSYKRPLSDTIAIIFGLIALFWMCLSLFFP